MTKPDHHLSADSDLADRLDAIFDRIEVSCDWRLSSEERQQIARAANALRPQPRPEAGPSNWRELEGAQLPDMKSGVKAPFHFRRYVNGVEMAEDVEISNASTVQEAFAKARALYGTPRGMDLVLTINEPQEVKEPCKHTAIICCDGKWHCQHCAAAVEVGVAHSRPQSGSGQ
jgi:hypothetical protein